MRQGGIQSRDKGCVFYFLIIFFVAPIALYVLFVPFLLLDKGMYFYALISGAIVYGSLYLIMRSLGVFKGGLRSMLGLGASRKGKGNKITPPPLSVVLNTAQGGMLLGNPFRGIFVVGGAGSGKSESIAVPILQQFIAQSYCGVVYDFKFPTLANDVQRFINANRSDLRHYYLNFADPLTSQRVNPLNPLYMPSSSYAREYAQALITNLMRSSIKKPDFWTESATDLLTAAIWYLREERPDLCDLPHVCALITSNDVALLELMQKNDVCAQMTISIYNALKRGADGQLSGVVGTLQGAIAKINTPELMYIFGGNDFDLNINNPNDKKIVSVGTYPTLATTLAPLCSLVITVASKLMNQPQKAPSFVMLDEAPTIYIPNVEMLPNTGRSNRISTVIMCQDLAQLTDGYGKDKSDVLFSSCNTHFYGRVASSHTSEVLSRQFGKQDRVYTTQSQGQSHQGWSTNQNDGESESVQERDVIKAAEFLNFNVGEFAGVAVETNMPTFRTQFLMSQRPQSEGLHLQNRHTHTQIADYYKTVRHNINRLLSNAQESTIENPITLRQPNTPPPPPSQNNDVIIDILG